MVGLIVAHPVMTVYLTASFVLTVMNYIVPEFVDDYIVIQGTFTPGTFLGTMVHVDFKHFFGNFIMLIPIWIYSDRVNGIGFTTLVIVLNMVITGIFVLIKDDCCCGASGISFMLLGLMAIIGRWWLLIIAVIMFFTECNLVKDRDNVGHVAHIVWQLIGSGFAVIICLFKGLSIIEILK